MIIQVGKVRRAVVATILKKVVQVHSTEAIVAVVVDTCANNITGKSTSLSKYELFPSILATHSIIQPL